MLPRPTKPIVVPGLRTGGSALVGEVIEHLLGDAEGLQAGRHAAVHGGLQQHLLDLLLRGPLLTAPRTCAPSSVDRFSAVSMARLMRLRVLRSRPGRFQTAPQQNSVTSSCIGSRNSVPLCSERST